MENYKLYILGYLVVIYIAYISYIVIKYGVLSSISDSYYKDGEKPLFTFFIWSISIPMLLIADNALMFLAASLLAFVGAAPAFRKETEGKVHAIGAIGGIVLAFASMIVDEKYIIPSIFVVLAFFLSFLKNRTWWIENLAFVLVIIHLLMK